MLEEKDMMKILSYILISLIQVINLFKFKYACHIKRLILIQKWSCTNNVTQRPWCKLLNTWIRCIHKSFSIRTRELWSIRWERNKINCK